MEARRRRLEWVERNNFQGWACSECAWVFNPSDPVKGDSLDDMKREFEEQRAKESRLTSAPNIEAREEPSPDSSDNRIYWRQHPLFRSAR